MIFLFIAAITFNVPLNNSLAEVDIESGFSGSVWIEYYRSWISWNHIRTVAAAASLTTFMLGIT